MTFEGEIDELRQRLAELQGSPVDENLTLEEISNLVTYLIMEREIPRYAEALRRLGES